MKVLFLSDASSIHSLRWAEALRDRGLGVHIASFQDAIIEGVKVHHLPTYGLGKMGYFAAVPKILKIQKLVRPEIVHAHYVSSYGFLAALCKLHPLIVTAWGTDVLVGPKHSSLSRFFVQHALRNAIAVTTVAEHMNDAVLQLGCESSKLQSIPFGVDVDRFSFPEHRLSWSPPYRVLCTRNFGPIYCVHTLLDAAAILIKKGIPIEVQLVGEGKLRKELEQQVHDLQLSNCVQFLGHVSHQELVSILKANQVFVSPARSDGNNISLNEAMACGCFPIATNIPANQQWIEDGVNGYLFEPENPEDLANCIERAIVVGDKNQQICRKNRELVEEKANWKCSVERMCRLYDKVAGA